MAFDFRKNIGQLLLAIWLILYGLSLSVGLTFQYFGLILGIIAVVAGILLLLGR